MKVVGNQGGVFFFQTVDFVGDHVVIQESLIFVADSFFAASLGSCLAFGFGTPLVQRLSHSTIVLCNALWVSLGALLFCLLLKPKPLTCVYISVLLATYAPVVLYAFTSMTQLCQYGVLLIYLAFLLRYARNRKPGWLFLSLVSVVLMCCFRINYLLLVLPVAWVCGGGKKLCLKTVLFSLLGLCLVIGVYLLTSQWSAPYAQGFPYALSQAGSFALMVRMLMSHFKANLIGFFAFYRYSPVLWWFRVFYLAMLALCLFKAFLQVRKDGKGLISAVREMPTNLPYRLLEKKTTYLPAGMPTQRDRRSMTSQAKKCLPIASPSMPSGYPRPTP